MFARSFAKFVFGAAILGVSAHAKNAPLAEPEFEGVFAEWVASTQTMRAMPRETPQQETKVKALGFGGAKSSMVWSGTSCTHRIRGNAQPSFVVRVASLRTDPHDIVQFYKVNQIRGSRRLSLATAKLFSGVKTDMNDGAVGFDAKVHGPSSIMVKSATALAPGEYVLSTPASPNSYCFGID